jgi:hypothetical protein
MAYFLLQQNIIHIEPIADLEIASNMQKKPESKTIPITQILNIVADDEAIAKEQMFTGYLANLSDVCNRFEAQNVPKDILNVLSRVKPSLVLVETGNGFTAGTAHISPRTCSLVKNINDAAIYIVSDSPFREVPSTGGEEFLIVESLK